MPLCWLVRMGVLGKCTLFGAGLVVLVSVGFGVYLNIVTQPSAAPQLRPQWWGPGQEREDDPTIKTFKINVSDEVLDDLRDRLELLPPLTSPLEGVGFQYGFNTDYLQKLVEFWLNNYNWRERETFLNSFPQFRTELSGLQLHYIHVKPLSVPSGTQVLPLLLLHGWPGSIREVYDLIPLLTKPQKDRNFVFEVIAPSLPGYGFSEGASKPGLGAGQCAVLFKSLMNKLGFNEFYVQGGDCGAVIGSYMGTLYPVSVLGLHSNMCFVNTLWTNMKIVLGSLWPSFLVNEAYVTKLYPLGEKLAFLLEESGYCHIQASKPDTIGIALRDSPVGLAAYILEKFSTWTDPSWRSLPDGGLTKKYSLTDLLDNVMIYWITGSITTSMRLYSETLNIAHSELNLDSELCTVPTACAAFPHEISYTPESLLRSKYVNLVKYTHMPRGGHFAAFEEPQLLADDIWTTVHIIRTSPSK